MNLSQINRQLASLAPGYAARFIAAPDESVDDEIEITFAGAPTRWALQIGQGYICINEYGEDADGEFWSIQHATFADLPRAVAELCRLLEAQP